MKKISRRNFLQFSALAGAAAFAGSTAVSASAASDSGAAAPAAPDSAGQENGLFAQAPVYEAALPAGGWQADLTFPDWAGYVDDTLAMNSMYSFFGYKGQGTLYITPADGVTGFNLFINNYGVKTSRITAGKTYAVDISSYTVNGTNTIQLTNIRPASLTQAVRVCIPYPVITQGTPEAVGLDPAVLDAIDAVIRADIAHGFTSAQLAVIKDGQMVYQNAWGTVNAYYPDGTPKTDSPAVTNDTLYDLASNTKMYSVNYALQYLATQGRVSLDAKIVDLLGEAFAANTIDITYAGYENPGLDTVQAWKAELTIRDVLRHQAGFPADPQYHNDAFDQSTQKAAPGTPNLLYAGSDGSSETRRRTLEAIFKTPLMYEPGTQTLYSDVDYMLLDFVIEEIVGQRLDAFLSETFWEPMGLRRITYQPLAHGFSADDCAATELNGNTRDGAISFTGARTYTLQGEVHDEKAYYAMGGVSGHAGLFATAGDLAALASVMLCGGYGNNKFFSRNMIDTFTAPKSESAANWGLGWWREADMARAWYFGTQSSSGAIGHQGWTGTLSLIDPAERLVVVYLTNKINSPVTDPAANPNKFDGNWYTASTLGFVAQLLYQGLKERAGSPDAALDALLADMACEHFRLVNAQSGAPDAAHPLVQSAYAMLEVLFGRAEGCFRWTARELARESLELLDPVRDAAELAELQARL